MLVVQSFYPRNVPMRCLFQGRIVFGNYHLSTTLSANFGDTHMVYTTKPASTPFDQFMHVLTCKMENLRVMLVPSPDSKAPEDEYVTSGSNLYYYRRRVCKNLSAKFDQFLTMHSQFDSDHRIDFYAHTCCQSATFGPLFAFYCPLFFTGKKINHVEFCQMQCLDAIFTLQFLYRCRHRHILKTTHNCPQLRTMVDFIVLSIKLVFMVLGISYSRVLYNN